MLRPLLLAFAFAGTAHAGPGIVGNGGDSVRCEPSAVSAFKGLYSLDYLLTYQTRNDNADVVPVFSWDESRERLAALLRQKSPDLAYGFASFVRDMDNSFDYTRPHIWREAGFGLVNIDDQRLIRKLPENCYKLNGDQSIDVIQTVVQTRRPDLAIFEYDPRVYDEFSRLAPLQFSFLMVHEWLWSLTDDVRVVRDVDRFLHSRSADQLAAASFAEALNNMGLTLRATDYVPVCDRSVAIRDALQLALGKSCGEIGPDDFKDQDSGPDLYKLSTAVGAGTLESFALGDFSGMMRLSELHLRGLGLEYLYEHQFDGVPFLEKLDLADNALTDFPARILRDRKRLNVLDLSGNKLRTAPRQLFVGRRDDDGSRVTLPNDVNLSRNEIDGLGDLASLPDTDRAFAIASLDLSFNKLRAVPETLCRFLNYYNANSSFARRGKLILTGNPLTAADVERLRNAGPCRDTTVIIF